MHRVTQSLWDVLLSVLLVRMILHLIHLHFLPHLCVCVCVCVCVCSVGAGLGGAGSVSVPVLEGESATLVCGTDLTGNPTPTITWTDNTGRLVNTRTLTFVSCYTYMNVGFVTM